MIFGGISNLAKSSQQPDRCQAPISSVGRSRQISRLCTAGAWLGELLLPGLPAGRAGAADFCPEQSDLRGLFRGGQRGKTSERNLAAGGSDHWFFRPNGGQQPGYSPSNLGPGSHLPFSLSCSTVLRTIN